MTDLCRYCGDHLQKKTTEAGTFLLCHTCKKKFRAKPSGSGRIPEGSQPPERSAAFAENPPPKRRKKKKKRRRSSGFGIPSPSPMIGLLLGVIAFIIVGFVIANKNPDKAEAVGFSMLAVGWLIAFVGGIWLLGVASQEGILHVLGVLLIPIYAIGFVLTHWEDCRKPFLIEVLGICLFSCGDACTRLTEPRSPNRAVSQRSVTTDEALAPALCARPEWNCDPSV